MIYERKRITDEEIPADRLREIVQAEKDDYFHCDYFYLEKLCGKFIPRCSHGYPDGHRKAHVNCGDDILNCPYVLLVADWLQNALGWKKP